MRNVKCKNSKGDAPYVASMWVGIGGLQQPQDPYGDSWLEQDGVEASCQTANSQPVFKPFWEVVMPNGHGPANEQGAAVFDNGKARVKPGDFIDAQVLSPAEQEETYPNPAHEGEWYFSVSVQWDGGGTNYVAYYKPPDGAYSGQTAEAITEWSEAYHCGGGPGGVLCRATHQNHGAVRDGFMYLGHVTCQAADYINSDGEYAPIPQNPIDLYNRSRLSVYPGQPSVPADSPESYIGFSTYYTSNWWTTPWSWWLTSGCEEQLSC